MRQRSGFPLRINIRETISVRLSIRYNKMRRKSLFFGIMLVLGLAGCVARPVEGPLPTLAPEVQEQEEAAGDEATGENKESEEAEGILDIGGLGVDIIRYVERSRVAADENLAAVLETAIETACYDYISDGTKLPEEPIRFRYTHELEELDDTYSSLKETIREIVGDDALELSDEDSYMMVEIFKKENGMPEVVVEIIQE